MDKAQVFYTDLMISIWIFALAVVLFIALSSNLQPQEDVFNVLATDSKSISSSLLSAGEPFDWTENNVTKIGLTDNAYRLNASKVARLMNFSPNKASDIFGANYKYVIFFKDRHGNVLNFNGCVFKSIDLVVNNISATICENFTIVPDNHLVSIERLVMYNSEIIKIVVQVWI